MHFRNDALDLTLLLATYSPGALENVSFMRNASNELAVILCLTRHSSIISPTRSASVQSTAFGALF